MFRDGPADLLGLLFESVHQVPQVAARFMAAVDQCQHDGKCI
jgi:hypothetical protein